MPDTKQGNIVSFERSQGFGKVAIDGAGELSFDATVSLATPNELVAGARVNVEIGPSRIPGRLKVTKLWLASSSGEVKDTGDLGPETPLMVGEYELLLPGFWADKSPVVHTKPGFARYGGAVTNGVAFDVFVVSGGASPEQTASVVATYVGLHASPRYAKREDVSIMGATFEVHRFDGSANLGEDVAYELYIGDVLTDCFVFGFATSMADSRQASLRELFKTMIAGAIVRRTSEVARARPKT